MTSRFTVLGSGSSGNAALLEAGGFGVLLDCGLGPQELSARLQAIGSSWQAVNAVVITHTHTDHWNKYTLEHLRRLNIPLVAHAKHHAALAASAQYTPLARSGLVREYSADTKLSLGTELTLRAVVVPHDSDPTFALRIDAAGWCWLAVTRVAFDPTSRSTARPASAANSAVLQSRLRCN